MHRTNKLSRRWVLLALLAFLLPFRSTTAAPALAPGDLDPTFGTGGKVTTQVTIPTSSRAHGMAMQADGKLVVAGEASIGSTTSFALARYNPDGSLDSTFGTHGRTTTAFTDFSRGQAVAIQADGKILVVGQAGSDFGLVRYNGDGSLDTSFGSGGKVTTDFAGGWDYASAVAVQGDGRILVAGLGGTTTASLALARYNMDGSLDISFGNGGKVVTPSLFIAYGLAIQADGKILAAGETAPGTTRDFGLMRFNTDGAPDASFGLGGVVSTDFAGGDDSATAIAVQANGRIVAAGYATNGGFALARYDTNGSLDSTFGQAGKVATDFSGAPAQASGLVLQRDGKIVAAGYSGYYGAEDFAVARYNPDGNLDSSFGRGGKATTDFAHSTDRANAIALTPTGKIVVAGEAAPGDYRVADFGLARYTLAGALDKTFGLGGKVTTAFPGPPAGRINALAIQHDGKVVAAGDARGSDTGDFALARYNLDGSLDTSFGVRGVVTTDFHGGIEYANALAIQSDGKIVVVGSTTLYTSPSTTTAIARYNVDGILDTSFGNSGTLIAGPDSAKTARVSAPKVDPKAPNPIFYASYTAVAIQADGKIVVAGYSSFGPNRYYWLGRLNPDGSSDPSFSTNQLFGTFTPNALAIQPDGKIIATGVGTSDFVTIRCNTDGSLDTSFGTGGIVTTDFSGSGEAKAVAVQPDGKIAVVGAAGQPDHPDFALARYNSDGSWDVSFGSDGIVTTDFAGGSDGAQALVIQPNGKIAVAGYAGSGNTSDFALALYNADGSLDSGFGNGGKVTIDFAGGGDTASGLVLQNGSKLVVGGTVASGNTTAFGLARLATDTSCSLPYSDVPQGSPFYPYVTCLVTRNIINGYSDCTYQPNNAVTRGQFAKFVANAAGYTDAIPRGQQTFTDVPSTDPFWLYIERAAAHGVISGYSNGNGTYSFRPGQPVTRGQAAKFVARAAGYREAIPATQQTFSDVPPADPFWLYIERVKAHGVIAGYADGTFHPRDAVTRGQTAKFIANALVPNCQMYLGAR